MKVTYMHAKQGKQIMRYRSKKDPWLVALLSLLLLPFLLGILYLVLPGFPGWTGWLLLFIGIAIVVGFRLTTSPTYYEITPPTLLVPSGLIHWEIALNSIQQVFPTNNPRSAPAWSLDRLQVDYSKGGRTGFILISPEDKLRFMYDLAANSEDLEVRDGRVVRRR
jgi:hypothetical protein